MCLNFDMCVSYMHLGRKRERDGETGRQIERQTERLRDRQLGRLTESQTQL